MRIVATLVLLLAAFWAAGWFVAARVAERAAETWFAEAAADGLRAGYDHLAVAGFPGRLVLQLEAPRVADPLSGTGWAAEGTEAELSVAAPRRLRLRPLGRQSAWLDGLRVDIDAAELTAEMLLRGLPPAPVAVTLHGAGLVLAGVPPLPAEDGTGWHLRLADVAGEMGLTGTAPILRLRADGITPGMSVWPAGTGPRPEGPLRLTLEAAAGFDQPVETGGRLTALRLDGLRLDWGASALAADGRLEVGADGVPQGRILVRAEGWRPLLGLAVASGWLDPGLAPTWLRVLETLQAAGSETARAADALELPVIFARGRVSLGPLPLGRAPLLAPPLPPGG